MSDLLSLIYKKREGAALTQKEINSWITSLNAKNPPPEYQTASLLSFIYSNGMNDEEITHLTLAMRDSGKPFRYTGFPKKAVFVDKHSTGGVGDKITLPLAALATACDERLYYPTIAGRGLGHTGGTVDKLESIPGLKTGVPMPKFYSILKKHQLCFLSQTKDIAPADRVLYALRDVTGTIESIPLITASILSKKLSETLDLLILDLKYGNGAFMTDIERSEALGDSIGGVCRKAGLKAHICLTRMDTPLGFYSGNRLEVQESIDILKGQGPEDSTQLTKDFAKRMLQFIGYTDAEAESKIDHTIQSGKAYEKFDRVVTAQGGSLSKFEKVLKNSHLKTHSILSSRKGYLWFDVRKLGLALVELGAGRKRKEDKIDFDVGFFHPLEAGLKVADKQEVLRVYYRDSKKFEACKQLLSEAIQIREEPFAKSPLIRKIIVT